jgi:2-oxo-4-hydroxy-4-carboxy-5-ureidoimidazoline decarboxylase
LKGHPFLAPKPMTIEALNALERDGFMAAIGWVFEDSPWVAERAWTKRPFANAAALHQSLVEEVEVASRQEQLTLLRAHPDLGTRARVSDASAAEQGGAGLDRLNPEEFEALQRLNTSYRDKFGFPFLFAVKGSTKHNILRALRARLNSGIEEEYAEALRQVYRIASFRIEHTVK